jgi:hypothetical protein
MTFLRMSPPNLVLAVLVLVAFLKGLRPATSLEKAVDDFHETAGTGLATACRCPPAFNFTPTLSLILTRANIRHLLPHCLFPSFVAGVAVVVAIIPSFMFL